MNHKIPSEIRNFLNEDIQLESILNLPQLANKKRSFEDLQEGYRFDSVANESLVKKVIWKDNWYVIATNYFADPFIIDVTENDYPVYFSMHGQGVWELEKIAHSFETFKAILERIEILIQNNSLTQIVDEIENTGFQETEFWQETIETVKGLLDPVEIEKESTPNPELMAIKHQIFELKNDLNKLNETRNLGEIDLKTYYHSKTTIKKQIEDLMQQAQSLSSN